MNVLQGKTVVITRPLTQAAEMAQLLEARGALPYLFPVIETVLVEDVAQLEEAVQQLHTYDWLVFTSMNAVKFFFQYIEQKEQSRQVYTKVKQIKIAAIGPKTAKALAAKGIEITELPQAYVQESLVDFLKEKADPGERVLFPKAEYTRNVFKEELEEYGLLIKEVPIYKTQPVQQEGGAFLEKLKRKEIDVLTFTSSSTVISFISIFEQNEQGVVDEFRKYLAQLVIASIGPITTRTAREYGLSVQVEAQEYTIEGLLTALEIYYQREQVEK